MTGWPYINTHVSYYAIVSTLLRERCPTDTSTGVGVHAGDAPVRNVVDVSGVSHRRTEPVRWLIADSHILKVRKCESEMRLAEFRLVMSVVSHGICM